MLIIHAKIFTMADSVIEDGWIRTKDDRIEALGTGTVQPKQGEEVLDVQGAGVYPGFVDAHTHLGMWEDGLTFEGDDGNEETDPVTPQLRAIDAVNPIDRCFSEGLAAGVTTVITGPGSANPIGGQLAAIKTCGGRIDDMLVKAPVAIKMALGENPKSVYHGKNQSPSTRMATAALIREELFKAQRYLQDLERSETDEDFDAPEFDMKSEALIPALRGETEVHFHAHRADDIFTAIRIAKEFDLDYVIVHGTEGHLIADALAKDGVRVLAGPFLCDRSKPELRNLTPQNPGILANAGILTAIITDHPVVPLQYLPTCAALAVREGMHYEDALKAITINPAKICGIDARVGSVEPGKDADLVVFDGNPLEMTSKPKYVIANGKIVSEREKCL
ncbi:amidohydrolase [Caproiciproducens faecalis]|uniref:Amidohydrolase n=1 Tax=Caproiciproducens faecalis TaxID=2820301 RepID=A0ABS7DR66_9FIRM|nr:amidohydrolase [Caproiciproducens faecalis]MBW7573683.1 amidohydrolase [Caproiciproducens faecalis]